MVFEDTIIAELHDDDLGDVADEVGNEVVIKTGFRGKPRRTWPQRILLLAGVLVALGCFGVGYVFWQASVVLGEVPRISVGPDVLAREGDPGEPINILLVGVDSSVGLDEDDPVRVGRELEDESRGVVRPDTILIARLDPGTGQASLLSLPRDLIVEVEGGTTTRLNATQAVGGIGALITAIDSSLSIPVNHFVQVDFAGFSDIVDIVGGVPVHFPFPTRDRGSGLSIERAGCFNLDGSESLSYVRARSIEEFVDGEWVRLQAASPDLARIERQQEFLALTTEEILNVGRSDLSRISAFVDAGVQAVQLDEELTPRDMVDLAAAFSDFDTEALEVATIPVEASFSEGGAYLGEQLVPQRAAELLARFQGADDGVRPDDVALDVLSDDERQGEQLAERGFAATTIDRNDVERTAVVLSSSDRERALLVARYLEEAPQFIVIEGERLRLEVGPDFAGVRIFPRPVADVAAALNRAITASRADDGQSNSSANSSANSPANSPAPETSVPGLAAEADPGVPSSSVTDQNVTSVSAEQALSPLDTAVRGRPPEGVGCGPTGS